MKYDVSIIGAGPGGSTVAKFLSEKGLNVLLADKSNFPRDKPCGGGLPAKVLERFGYIKDNDLIEAFSYGGYMYSSSLKYKIEVKKDKPIIAMVLRKKFDYGLIKLAIDGGAKFIEGKKAIDVKILDNKAEVIFDDGSKVESDVVVGADGVWSTVAKKTGLLQNNKNVSLSLYSEIPMDIKTMDKYFTKKRYGHMHLKLLGLPGYGWVFPKKEHVNIGIGEINLGIEKTKNKLNLKEMFTKYICLLKDNKLIPNNLEIGKINGSAIPNCPIERTYADRVVLVGDAAGLANPLTGEGIDYAMYSGMIAAEIISEGLEKGDVSSNFLSKYESEWKRNFGKDLKLFFKSAKRWGEGNENFIKHASRDEILSEMILNIASGNLSIYKCKWRLVRRYLYCVIKDFFFNRE